MENNKTILRFLFDTTLVISGLDGEENRDVCQDDTLEVETVQNGSTPEYLDVYLGDFQTIWNLPRNIVEVI